MALTINWNGNHEIEPLDTFFERLRTEPLHPMYEPFAVNQHNGQVLFWGNFYNLSAGFSILTDDPSICQHIIAAIKENQASHAYKQARREWFRLTR